MGPDGEVADGDDQGNQLPPGILAPPDVNGEVPGADPGRRGESPGFLTAVGIFWPFFCFIFIKADTTRVATG